ncbi:hypothetical protein Uis1B_1024 [Bifidobacterium margollesii]|uniref:DUF881 domain-containing protein n=1 Tax=Bifidobacterium margollesii TaxID=2020964 RepID=A0A2N5JAA8_9BIFI|nr:DUF881 domain-containing protein [Bifidobacterium margollesii]PLS31140.1 hypothetical protein Uis1B_1024 [Bifidobacterium margollesii]
MGKHGGRHVAKRSIWGGIAMFVILALVGFLFSTNVRVNRTVVVTSDTTQLINERARRVDELQTEINSLSTKIDSLKALSTNTKTPTGEEAGAGTKLPAVEGPGVTVTLNDSPLWEQKVGDSGSTADINDYVVHQQDIEAVVNALWAGGAESMTIQDQRVLFDTAVRCVGNVLLLHGKQYAPPYRISAIGPTDRMIAALDDSPTIQIYQQYVASIGLGWQVERKDLLKFPEATSSLQTLKYATVENSTAEKSTAKTK